MNEQTPSTGSVRSEALNDAHAQIHAALHISLSHLSMLWTLAKSDSPGREEERESQARETVEGRPCNLDSNLINCLHVLASEDGADEWRHLDAWQFVAAVVERIRPHFGQKNPWTTTWGRLRGTTELAVYSRLRPPPARNRGEPEAPPGSGNARSAAGRTGPVQTAAPPGDNKGRWLTVTEAARIAVCNAGVISAAVDAGQLKSNGLKQRPRRVDAVDLTRWMLARAGRPEPSESVEAVERLVRCHVHD